LQLAGKTIDPAKAQRREHHRPHLSGGVENRLGEVDGGLAGDAADLVVADGKVARLQRPLKIGPVAGVHPVLGGQGAAVDLAVRLDGA
jgi:hypothetical protein